MLRSRMSTKATRLGRDISRFADIENVLPTGERITKLTEEPLDLGYKHFCEKVEAIKTYFSKISLPTRGL
ncbi:hypothetical protein M513_06918 [Trichuris suis]|uniref:Uncharacterized protein n=1 Tax=Trichuris suis TaxID=68888 RepID=A0A085M4Q9_9BILA|nr:hypothetical protein M513_06918 [Trichuris suis]